MLSKEHVTNGKIQGRIKVTGRRKKRRKNLVGGLTEKRGYRKFREQALNRTLWRTRCVRNYWPVIDGPRDK
jgi:hypothetical protein